VPLLRGVSGWNNVGITKNKEEISMLKRLKSKRSKKNEDDVAVESRKVKTLTEKFDSYTEAITFAEAGLPETARELIGAQEVEKAKVLVVGNGDTFGKPVIDYTVGLAERMGFQIVALNVNPPPAHFSKVLGSHGDRLLYEAFKSKCEQAIAGFRAACEEKGIPLTHLVRLGDVDECVKEVHQEVRRVEFVITEPESYPEPEHGRVAIPVFCMAS
jgi:hypothetical protein